MQSPRAFLNNFLCYALIIAAVIAALMYWKMDGGTEPACPPLAAVPAASALPPGNPAPAPVAMDSAARIFNGFGMQPLAVAKESGTHQWTAEDGRLPETIRRIAHNELEVRRMTEENPTIHRRQLVYRKDPTVALVERARATGEPVRTLMLPGIDGQELEVEVTKSDLAPSGLSGTLTGRLAGRGQSMVIVAFKFGREAFTGVSPEDGIFLQAEPREPGEIVVKKINPVLYAGGRCGVVLPRERNPASNQEPGCCGN